MGARGKALDAVGTSDSNGFFTHCGYGGIEQQITNDAVGRAAESRLIRYNELLGTGLREAARLPGRFFLPLRCRACGLLGKHLSRA